MSIIMHENPRAQCLAPEKKRALVAMRSGNGVSMARTPYVRSPLRVHRPKFLAGTPNANHHALGHASVVPTQRSRHARSVPLSGRRHAWGSMVNEVTLCPHERSTYVLAWLYQQGSKRCRRAWRSGHVARGAPGHKYRGVPLIIRSL